ncbi:MAG: tetratricopeptide repeat protein [Hylemonella sp.]|nr:tetratricopeptide repeat protein [Hylemonella sp.]
MDQRLLSECLNTAQISNARRDFRTALWWCDKALEINPEVPEGWFHRGIALTGLGQMEAAKISLEGASSRTLGSADAQNNIGLRFLEMHAYGEAEVCLRRAISLAPDYAFPYVNLGRLLSEQKQNDRAIAALQKGIELQPGLDAAYTNLGGVLCNEGRLGEAEAACQKAIGLNPKSPEAFHNYGLVLAALNRHAAAALAFREAIVLNAKFLDAHFNLANVSLKLKRHADAVQSYQKCLQLDPAAEYVHGALLAVRMKVCDWADHASDLKQLGESVEQGRRVTDPFFLLALVSNLKLQRKAAELLIADKYPESPALGGIPKRKRGERIRIGYFSADFRNHPVANLMVEIFELQDRSRFELIAFSWGPGDEDVVRQRVRSAFDQFIDVNGKSDLEVASLARSLEIDLGIDLGGHTEYARTGIFAYRAAPVQVSYLGYLGTMGAPYYEYLIADAVLVPEAHQTFYVEKIAYLPSYQPNDSKRSISDRRFTRAELGLPEEGFVFCCFNSNYKFNPNIFDIWMRVLLQVEDGVIFLYAETSEAAENLKKEAQRRGVDRGRVVTTLERLTLPEYLARYRVADLFLDTQPYNAGTTASDALWTGLPVLTCLGESFAGRMAASLLHALGLPELVAANLADYEELAVALALDGARLKGIRDKLERNRLTAPLFDSCRFTLQLERMYEAMYERYQADLPPTHLRLD